MTASAEFEKFMHGLKHGAYGMIRWKQANMGFADHGLTFGNPDFVARTRGVEPRAVR